MTHDAGAASASSAAAFSLGFIDDDYEKALADARTHGGRPIFVDVWATWCHTCLSLKNFVLTDAALSEHKDRFTWLAIDSEKPENAALVERLGLRVLPTLWVIDPKTEKPTWTWKGALTTPELSTALREVSAGPTSKTSKTSKTADAKAKAELAQADAAAAKGRSSEALAHYRAALAETTALPAPERARVVDSFVSLLSDAKAIDECASVAGREGPRLPEGTYRVDVAVVAVSCIADAKPESATRKLLPALIAELSTLTSGTSQAVLVDDRSSAYDALVAALKTAGDKAAAKKAAADWATMLEAAAARSKTAVERVVFDAHRLNAYLELDEPGRALPMLEASEKDFPDDYNPSARKARALLELGRHDDALAAADRALARAYGGRRLQIYLLRADILEKKGEPAKARATLEAALEDSKAMTLRAGYKRLRDSVADRLRARSLRRR